MLMAPVAERPEAIGILGSIDLPSSRIEPAITFFARLLKRGGLEPQLRTDNSAVQARLHNGAGGRFLWIINPTRSEAKATVTLNVDPAFRSAEDIWNHRSVVAGERSITITVPGRDAAVLALR